MMLLPSLIAAMAVGTVAFWGFDMTSDSDEEDGIAPEDSEDTDVQDNEDGGSGPSITDIATSDDVQSETPQVAQETPDAGTDTTPQIGVIEWGDEQGKRMKVKTQ